MRHGLTPLVLALLAACATEPAPADAPVVDDGAGGSGGGGVEPGCVDHRVESTCPAEGAMSGCAQGEICGLPDRRCGDAERCCTLATSCGTRAEGRPGGAFCDEDTDCGSGACLAVAGRGLCFRACDALLEIGCPIGTHCSIVSLDGGASVSTCLGGTAAAPDPLSTICRVDRECPDGRVCRIVGYAEAFGEQAAPVGLCSPPTGGEAQEIGQRCDPPPGTPGVETEQPAAFSAACPAYGLCAIACDFTPADVCVCTPAQLAAGECRSMRCSRPCRGDPDCPNGTCVRASRASSPTSARATSRSGSARSRAGRSRRPAAGTSSTAARRASSAATARPAATGTGRSAPATTRRSRRSGPTAVCASTWGCRAASTRSVCARRSERLRARRVGPMTNV